MSIAKEEKIEMRETFLLDLSACCVFFCDNVEQLDRHSR